MTGHPGRVAVVVDGGPAQRPWALAVATAMAIVVALVGQHAAAASTAGDEVVRVAVLGDSYVSGEGLPTAAGPCGVTEEAWGAQVGRALGDPSPQVLACSGADVADVLVGGDTNAVPQLAAVDGPVDVAVLVTAGNDLGFAELVVDCLDAAEQLGPEDLRGDAAGRAWQSLLGSGRASTGCDVDEDELLDRVASFRDPGRFALPDGGTGGLADVYTSVADAVVVDGGTLLVATYPALFAPTETWATRYGRRCHGVLAEDADRFVGATTALAELVDDQATLAAEELAGRVSVVVADVRAASTGDPGPGEAASGGREHHGLCGPGEPWVNGLTLREGGLDLTAAAGALLSGQQLDLAALGARPTASFHPNTAGHAAIAAVALDALAEATGTRP